MTSTEGTVSLLRGTVRFDNHFSFSFPIKEGRIRSSKHELRETGIQGFEGKSMKTRQDKRTLLGNWRWMSETF